MSIPEKVPGMKEDATLRNIALGLVYCTLLVAILSPGGGDTTAPTEPAQPEDTNATQTDTDKPEQQSENTSEKDSETEIDNQTIAEQAFIYAMEQETEASVEKATHSDGEFVVTLTTEYASQQEIVRIIGGSVGAYSEVVNMDAGGERMVVEIQSNNTVGTYHTDAADVELYVDGEITAEQLSVRTIETLETPDE